MTRRYGLTVLELVVVMAIVMVMAAIAIPVALSAQREAREAKLVGNLREIRSAIGRFAADCGGYPRRLEDLVVSEPPGFCHSTEDGRRMDIDRADFRGPYLYTPDEKFPKDPITRKRVWSYKKKTGEVRSCAAGSALDGTRYKDW